MMSATETRCPYPGCGAPLSCFEVVCPTCERELFHCPTCGALLTPGTSVCDTCGERASAGTPGVDERLTLLADSYRQAALNNVSMRTMADALEPVRAAMFGDENRYEAWNTIKDQIGQFRGEGVNSVLNELRVRYLQYVLRTTAAEIDVAFSTSPERGWNEWLGRLAEAWSEGPISLLSALAAWPFSFAPSVQAVQESIRKWARFVEMGQWAEALPLFEFLSERSELAPALRGHCLRAAAEIQLYHLEAPAESERLIQRFQALTPDDKAIPVVWSEFYLQKKGKKGYDEALKYAERAIEVDSSSPAGYNAKGDVLQEMRDPLDKVDELYRQALRAKPGDTTAYTNLIRLYGRPDNFATHKDTIELLVRQGSTIEPLDRYGLCLEAAQACRQNNEYEQAHNWYQQAVRLDPTRPRGLVDESFCYVEEEDWAKAKERLLAAVQVAPEVFEPYWWLGWVHEQQKDWTEARHWYEASLPYRLQWRSRIQSKMAEMQWQQGEFDQAEQALYAMLKDDKDSQFPVGSLENLAEEYKQGSNTDAARRIYANILEIKRDSYRADYDERVAVLESDMALIENAEGNTLYADGKYREAADKYRQAIAFTPKDAVLHSNLAGALENQKTPGHRAEELAEAISEMQQASALAPQISKNIYADQLKRLQDSLALIERYAESTPDLLPVVTPIVLEIESALVAADTSTERWVLFTDYIPRMRTDIQKRMGIGVTGVHVRGNNTLGIGGYSIQLDEVPIVSATTWPGWGFTRAPREELVGRGIPEENLVSALDPLSGKPACWVNPNQYDAVKALGFEIEADPLVFVIDHLEAVLLQNIGDFATFQQISTLVDSNGNPRAASLIPTVLPDQEARLRLWQVLKTLLRQHVPITALADILEAVQESGLADLESAVRHARLRLKPDLPGNRPGTRRIALPSEQEAALEAYRKNGDTAGLVQAEFEVLSAVRNVARPDERNVALVVAQAELAPLLRQLLQVELPYAAVLTREELLAEEEPESRVETSVASANGG